MTTPDKIQEYSEKYGINDATVFAEHFNRAASLGSTFLGVWTEKNKFDAWTYQELLFKNRPDVVVECGSFKGGSAWYLAHIMDLIGHGEIISIDINDNGQTKLKHPRITWLIGSTIEPSIVKKVKKLVGNKTAMVLLDSEHTKQHVAAELEAYHDVVSSGQYLVVEDTLTLFSHSTTTPLDAIHEFVPKHPEYVIDKGLNKEFLTCNVDGFLLRV